MFRKKRWFNFSYPKKEFFMKNLGQFFGTQKQWFCVVILALICAGTAFSQARQPAPAPAQPGRAAAGAASSTAKNAISLDIMPLFKGILSSDQDAETLYIPISLGYERWIIPHMSIGLNLDMYFGKVGEEPDGDDIPYFYFGMAIAWRYYPMSDNMEKFFVGAIIGFNAQAIDGKTKSEDGGFVGPIVGVSLGYRAFLGKVFFVEPSLGYVYSKYNGFGPTPLGWQGGLRLGVAFGK
jgi:hypothetical protein